MISMRLRGPRCVNSPRVDAAITKYEGTDGLKLRFGRDDESNPLWQSLSRESASKLGRALLVAAGELYGADEDEPGDDDELPHDFDSVEEREAAEAAARKRTG